MMFLELSASKGIHKKKRKKAMDANVLALSLTDLLPALEDSASTPASSLSTRNVLRKKQRAAVAYLFSIFFQIYFSRDFF